MTIYVLSTKSNKAHIVEEETYICQVCGEEITTDDEDELVVEICPDCQEKSWWDHI